MSVKVKKEIVDLLSMKEKMDVIVFDYIDTANHWSKAFKSLSAMLHQLMSHYKSYVQSNEGQPPASNSYWLLFADLSAKLAYFNALTMFELQKEQAETHVDIERLLLLAGYGLPTIDNEENEEMLEQIVDLYKKLSIKNIKQKAEEFEATIIQNKGSVQEALSYFHTIWVK